MEKNMRILQLCNKPPFPPMDGGAIGMNNVTMGLVNAGHEVKVVSLNTHKHYVDIQKLPEDYKAKTGIELLFVDTRLKPLDAFFNLFTSRSYHVTRFYDKKVAARLKEILEKEDFDIVQVESVFLKDYLPDIRRSTRAKVVLRAPNVEYKIWERLANEESNPLKKWYLNLLFKRLKKEETGVLNAFDAVYTVTHNDLELLRSEGMKVPGAFIPTGPDVNKKIPEVPPRESSPTLFHLGALDWMPNQEGIFWFLEHVWPEVVKAFPGTHFYIAGRRPSAQMLAIKAPQVHMLGEIEDAAAFMNEHSVMVVPLFSGSGMRVKIVEGMMAGKAVVSTSVGAEGLVVHPGKDILIADTAEAFIRALSDLLEDPGRITETGRQARANCEAHYSEKALTDKLVNFFNSLI